MQQLSGLDALFSYNESPNTPMHIGVLSTYLLPQGATEVQLKDVIGNIESKLDSSVIFRRKLVKIPGNISRPYWSEQKDFDIRHHVKQVSLQKKSLYKLLADLHARPLDMSRPLWQIWFINHLHDRPGQFALYLKVHHSAIDGISGAEIFTSLHTRAAGQLTGTEVIDKKEGDARLRKSRQANLLKSLFPEWSQAHFSNFSNINRTRDKLHKIGQLATIVKERNKAREKQPDSSLKKTNWVKTRFNTQVSSERVIDVVEFPLADLRQIRRALAGTTINHVLLTIIGGALREYLLSKADLPQISLSSVVPMNVRNSGKEYTGNVLSLLLANLHTDMANPMQRLQAVRDSATQGRQQSLNMGKDTAQIIADILPASTAAFGLKALSGLSLLPGESRLPFNTVVSSLSLPPIPLFFAGAQLQQLVGLGLLVNHIGLFHTSVTYNKSLVISVLACKKIMPDVEYYAECLKASFDQLRSCVREDTSL